MEAFRTRKAAEREAAECNRQSAASGFTTRYEATQKPNGWWTVTKVEGSN